MRPTHLRKNCEGEIESVHEVFDDLVYKPSWFNFDLMKVKTVVDVGALIGSFTLWAQEQWPNAIINAYEPDPESFEYLKKNIEWVKSKKILAFNSAVWSENKQLTLHRFANTPGNNTVVYEKRPFTSETEELLKINTRKISDVIKEIGGKIDFLKLDCEGSEYNILYSLSRSELKKIKFMVIEFHEFDNFLKLKGKVLSDFLRKNGFVTQIIPTNIRKNTGLGYIYASSVHKTSQILLDIFDNETAELIKVHKISNEREDYAKSLEISIQSKNADLEGLNKLVREKDTDLEGLNKLVREKDADIDTTNQILANIDNELMYTRSELNEIKKSLIFRMMRKIGGRIDSDFPNATKRGEFKKILASSTMVLANEGFRKYLSEVRTKIRRKEFKVLSPINISQKEESLLLEKVKKNRMNRLQIRPLSEQEIKKDEFIIPQDEELS